uniref:Putative salivary secreted protein variant n=1 Tax=Ornithodoros turicata TaxID=34597 RepID=A0A2R5LGT0_9ACAR
MATAIYIMVLLVVAVVVAADYNHPWDGGKHSNCDMERTEVVCGPSTGSHWPELWIYQRHRETCDRKKVCPALLSFAFKRFQDCRDEHKRCEKWKSCRRKLEEEEERRKRNEYHYVQ